MTTLRRSAIPRGTPAARPLRADARRNHERILKAARAVFAEQGSDAQIDDVAKKAKVGVGTVYRHFPTKEALLDALIRERFAVITGYAHEALEREDAWEGFCELIWRAAETNAADRSFSQAMAKSDQSVIVQECGLAAATDELMRRAQAQGSMRPDATHADVQIMMCGAGSVMSTTVGDDRWRRYLTLMLDGLRAT